MLSIENMTECMRYGIWNGCDKDCPVLKRGDCEVYDSEEEVA